MRGTPYLRLRRTVARALRRAFAGSFVLASLVIALATLIAASEPEHSEASAESPTTTETAAPAIDQSVVLAGPPLLDAIQIAPLTENFAAVPDLAALAPAEPADTALPSQTERRVATSALRVAGAVATLPTAEERLEALLERAAERGNQPAIAEPPFVVTEGQTGSPYLVPGDIIEATISFYYCELGDTASGGDGGGFCGPMRDGTVVYEGAAACAFTYLGQRFRIVGDPTGRTYTCHDTGNAVHGLHRDIFFYSAADGWPWLNATGTRAILEIVE